MKQKVLQFIGSFHEGGSERQAVQLCSLLKDEGSFQVFAATLDRSGSLLNEIGSLKLGEIPEYKLTSFYDANFIKQAKKCAEFIRRNEIDVVHTHDFYTNIFGMTAAFLARRPARIASKRETLSKSGSQFFIERQSFRLADRIVANAGAVKDFLTEQGVPHAKIETIYNGIDIRRVAGENERQRNSILTDFGLPAIENLRFVTLVANMRSEVKDHRMFLKGAAKISEKFENVRFIAAGEGELTGELKEFSNQLGIGDRVFFTGRCSNVANLLAVSDVCVLTSRSEGFSNSILEYMAAGKPVIATDVGGANEAIVEGETGFLVNSGDDSMFSDRVLELLLDGEKAERFGEAGKSRVERLFSTDAQLGKTIELYKSVLKDRSKI